MNTMDNAKAIETMEKITLHKYLEKLINSQMRKITLFPSFPQTGAPNLSEPVYFMMINDISKLAGLNSGAYKN